MQRKQLPTWQFGIDNDKLVELVLEGKKTATTSLDITNVSKPGERSILTFENEKKACIVETKKVIITQFKNITPEMAFSEGEGNRRFKKNKISILNDNLDALIPAYIVCYNEITQEQVNIAREIEEEEEQQQRNSKYITKEY